MVEGNKEDGPKAITVRAMIISDVKKIQDSLDPKFDVRQLMQPLTIAFVAQAGDDILGYMVYKLDKGKAIIQSCITNPEFKHAAIDMIIALMTGGVMEEVREKPGIFLKRRQKHSGQYRKLGRNLQIPLMFFRDCENSFRLRFQR